MNNHGLPVSPVFQLLVWLRFYATASFQLVTGDLLQLSQSTVSRVVFRVSILIASLMQQYIKMPSTPAEEQVNRRLFRDLAADRDGIGFPEIDGAIDCIHICLTSTNFQISLP